MIVPRDQLAQISGNGTYRVIFGHETCARSASNGVYWGLELSGCGSLVRVRRPDGERVAPSLLPSCGWQLSVDLSEISGGGILCVH